MWHTCSNSSYQSFSMGSLPDGCVCWFYSESLCLVWQVTVQVGKKISCGLTAVAELFDVLFFCCRPVFQNVNSTGCSSVESAEFVFVLVAVSGWAGGKNTGIASEWIKTSCRKRVSQLLGICFISACVHPRCLFLLVFCQFFCESQEVRFSVKCAEFIILHHIMLTTELHPRLIHYVCFVTKLQAPPFPRDINYALSFRPWTPACFSHPPQDVLRSQEKTPAANHLGCSRISVCAWLSGVKEILCSSWTREVLSIFWKQESVIMQADICSGERKS